MAPNALTVSATIVIPAPKGQHVQGVSTPISAEELAMAQLAELGLTAKEIQWILEVTPPSFARDAVLLGIAARGVENPEGSSSELRRIRREKRSADKKYMLNKLFGFVGIAITNQEINSVIDGARKYLSYMDRLRR